MIANHPNLPLHNPHIIKALDCHLGLLGPPGSPGSEVQREQWDEMLEKKVGPQLHSASAVAAVRGQGNLLASPK
jgi:hypothetical protein